MKEQNILKELKLDKVINLEYLEKKLNEAEINYHKSEDTIEIYVNEEQLNIKYKKVPSNYFKGEIRIEDIKKNKISESLPLNKL